jgi:hypothetical protein
LLLPEPIFPQFPERLNNPGPEVPPEKRKWAVEDIYRTSRGWLFPYVRSRVLLGEFHPITAYLFIEYKCNPSEIETTAGKQHHDSAISPPNYTLNMLGEQQVGPYRCFVVQVIPKRRDKYLFEGKVWIDAKTMRLSGSKAIRRRSFLFGSSGRLCAPIPEDRQLLASTKRYDPLSTFDFMAGRF